MTISDEHMREFSEWVQNNPECKALARWRRMKRQPRTVINVPQTNEGHMREFVAWARWRRTQRPDAPVCEESFEYVVSQIESILDGKGGFKKSRGRPKDRAKMWECFYLIGFAKEGEERLRRHTLAGGGYQEVGGRLGISPEAVATHFRNAREAIQTEEGRIEFLGWLAAYTGNLRVDYIPKAGG